MLRARVLLWAFCALLAAHGVRSAELYTLVKSIPLGAPDRWDYLAYDAPSGRLYVTHSGSIDVLDGHDGKIIGKVTVPGANGVALTPEGKAYAGSREHHSVIVFDMKSLQIIKEIPADEDTDAVVYDPSSRRIFVMEGDPHRALVIDSATDAVAGRIELGGSPEFAAADSRGKLFVNLEDQRAIVRVDTHSMKVEARWPVAQCEAPHGLAMDVSTQRLFATCVNSRMIVLDASNGHVVGEVPIGKGTDGAGVDPRRRRAFSSNGEGTLSVVQANAAGHYELLANVATVPTARTLFVDTQSGRIYLTCGERIEVDPAATNPRQRYGIRPGSARVLFLDPAQ